MSRRRNTDASAGTPESSGGQDNLSPTANAKVARMDAAIRVFFEDNELEVPELDVALQAREAYADTSRDQHPPPHRALSNVKMNQ